MKPSLLIATALSLVLIAPHARAEESISDRIAKLEQEIALLKRQQEVSDEKAQAAAEKTANVEYGTKGLVISSPDKRYSIKFREYVQADTRTFFDDSNVSGVDQFTVRTARMVADATFDKDFGGRFMFDVGGSSPKIVDAFVEYKPYSAFNLRLGRFKAPIGLERWQSEQEVPFVERGLANNMVPNRDDGAMVYGEFIPQTLEYQLALTNGGTDLGDSNGDIGDSKDVVARLFAHPFRDSDVVALQGLGVGVAGSYGERDGAPASTDLVDGYRSQGQARFFGYRTGAAAGDTTFADGTTWRINPQAYYYVGPFGALAEYVYTEQDVRRGANAASLQHDALTAYVSYVLTGEDASYEGIKPRNNFSLTDGGWGAWELVARYSQLNLDDDTFPTYANLSSAASAAYDKTVGINWHLNPNLKIITNFTLTEFDGGAAGGRDRESEKLFTTRTQFRF